MEETMSEQEFNCLPTALGCMPHTDVIEAYSTIMRYLPEIPAWPQLPNRTFTENMYVQFSEGFPGAVVIEDKAYIEPPSNFTALLNQIQDDAKQEVFGKYSMSEDYAEGLHFFLSNASGLEWVKGQVTGPISWGLTIKDNNGKAIIYNQVLAPVIAKFLRLKAAWQDNVLNEAALHPIIFIDEPRLTSLDSTIIPPEIVTSLLEEVLQGIKGIKGIYCCGDANWPLLLATSIDILSFDTYNNASSLEAYPSEVVSFLKRGGVIGWGIVPHEEDKLAEESVASLRDRLSEAMLPFTRDGINFRQVVAQSLLTPSSGLAGMSTEAASEALHILAELSASMREKYVE